MILTPNEIAALIYWSGTFTPDFGIKATDKNGHIVQTVPKPGSPVRTKIEHWLDIAIAVCLAESGGDTLAKNASSTASGLWQVMVSVHAKEIRDAQIQWESQLSNGKNLTVFDPRVNTTAAGFIWQKAGNSWSPWEAYTSGAYKSHLGHGKDAYAFMTSKDNLQKMRQHFIKQFQEEQNAASIIAATLTPFSAIGGIEANTPQWVKSILSFLAQSGLVVGIFLLGLILIGLGLWTAIRKTPAGKTVKSAVKVAAIV
ncbi:MAG TPA: transglycosylase SLT domain-containing protein [Candidatus Paceibacterota bacterium]